MAATTFTPQATDHDLILVKALLRQHDGRHGVGHDCLLRLVADAELARTLDKQINNPQTADFLTAVASEAAHQVQRWGDAHERGKSAENWFWLVGYLAGKCLRSCIEGDKFNAQHHTVSSAAALLNWWKAIEGDQTGCGVGQDRDIKPVELARFEAGSADEMESLENSEADARELP
jgi:hypothetical protein